MSCIELKSGTQKQYELVIVPVRGMSCIQRGGSLRPRPRGYRPREGYELHHRDAGCTFPRIGYRPREGYELHRERFLLKLGVVPNVIVPVRGMSCIVKTQMNGG